MNARYYDPETGRFISQDTYRGEGEAFWHLYLYCDSDPVNNIDPTGHAYYNRNKAIQYAKKWAYGRNQQFYAYDDTDCANFVSQCLYAGGIPKNSSWHSYRSNILPRKDWRWGPSEYRYKYRYNWNVTPSWSLVKFQRKHFIEKKYSKKDILFRKESEIKTKGVKKGDLVYFDDNGDSIYNHAAMVNRVSGSKIYYTGHTNDTYDFDLSYYFKQYRKGRVQIIMLKDNI